MPIASGAKVNLTHQHHHAAVDSPTAPAQPQRIPPSPPLRCQSMGGGHTGVHGSSAAELSQMLHTIADHQHKHGLTESMIGTPTSALKSFGTPQRMNCVPVDATGNHNNETGGMADGGGASPMYVAMDQHPDEQLLLQQRRWTQQQRQQRHILTMVRQINYI